MNEELFYDTLDKMESVDKDITSGYYPSIEDLKEYQVEKDIDLFLPIIAYFASDPFKRIGIEPDSPNQYSETVSFCKEALARVNLA